MPLNRPKLIKPIRHGDHRGFFSETYSRKDYEAYGIDMAFVQDNQSVSQKRGTIRGLHFQAPPHAQAKLVRCGSGAIYDVVVDVRRGSPNYGMWEGYELSAENGHQLYVPVGFAHGFVTLEPNSEILYRCSDYYAPSSEGAVLWSDPDVGIEWPVHDAPILSEKDEAAPCLKEFETPFIYGDNS